MFDKEVRESAIAYIREHIPEVNIDIDYALRQENKVNMARAWRIVADKVGSSIGTDLGMMATHSWTAVNAIPQRIVSRMGGWEAPREKPEFEHPQRSGRILLANNYGVGPDVGPGVDESPVFTERRSTKRTYVPETPENKETEEDTPESFSEVSNHMLGGSSNIFVGV